MTKVEIVGCRSDFATGRALGERFERLLGPALLLVTLLIGPGCSDAAKPRLLSDPASNAGQFDLNEEHRRKQEMQRVQIFDRQQGLFRSIDPSQLANDVFFQLCLPVSGVNAEPACRDGRAGACYPDLCFASTYLCTAHMLAEIVGIRSDAFRIDTAQVRIDVPPQSAAANAELARLAADNAAAAAGNAASGISICTASQLVAHPPLPGQTGAGQLQNRTYGEALSTTFVEAYHLFKDVTDLAVSNAVATADAEFSSTPSLTQATARALTATQLSRSAAAHWLVGGDPGFIGSETDALCSAADLTSQARTAIGLFREAAMAPADLTGGLSISDLLVGDLPEGSLRQRLAEFWNSPGVVSHPDLFSPSISADRFAELFALRVDDFVEARRYLSQEIRAFSRTMTAVLPPRPLVGDRTSSFNIYAATAKDPEPLDPAYFSTLGRFSAHANQAPALILNSAGGFPGGLAQFTDAAVSRAAQLVQLVTESRIPDPALRDDIVTPLAVLLSDGERERRGRLRVEIRPDSTVIVHADGFSAGDILRVVIGEDGLRCATQGAIEGATCDLEALTLTRLLVAGLPAPGFQVAVERQTTVSPVDSLQGKRLYLVQARSSSGVGCSPNPMPLGSDRCPGDFEALVGVTVGVSSGFPNAGPEVTIASIVPDADRRAGELLELSRRWCTRPRLSCAGETFDARLPLEDELSDDGNDVESSWKHYLALARQSATEADLLGEEVIRLGLEMDLRSEAAQEELQDICGIQIDSQVLLNALSTNGANLNNLRTDFVCTHDHECTGAFTTGTACSVDGECSSHGLGFRCVSGSCQRDAVGPSFRCTGGRCMRDPIELAKQATEDTDLNRLSECLGNDTVVDLVTPGQRRLCVWQAANDPNRICTGSSQVRCPMPAVDEVDNLAVACPASVFKVPNDAEPKLVSVKLGYFDNTRGGEPQKPAVLGEVCDAIRALRSNKRNDHALLNTIRGSDFFHPDRLVQLGKTVGWEARFGGYSAITVDERPMFSTGDAWNLSADTDDHAAPTWPCRRYRIEGETPEEVEARCASVTAGKSLFCDMADCSNSNSRALMNDRMFRAVVAIRDTTQDFFDNSTASTTLNGAKTIPLTGVRIPYLVRLFGSQEEARAQASSQRIAQSGATVSFSTIPVDATGSLPDRDVEFYFVDSNNPSHSIAWMSPALEGSTSNGTVRAQPVLDPSADHFAIGDLGLLALRGMPAGWRGGTARSPGLTWWSGLSSSAFYLQPDTQDPRSGWFLGVLSGAGAPGDIGQPNRQTFGAFAVAWARIPAGFWQPLMADFRYSEQAMLDGMELLCEIGRTKKAGIDIEHPPLVQSVQDLGRVKIYFDLVADELLRRSGNTIFANLPKRAVDALRNESSTGSYPAVGGKYGASVSRLRGALVQLSGIGPKIATEIQGLGRDMDALRIAIERGNVASEIADVQFLSTVAAQVTACATSFSLSDVSSAFKGFATCANSAAQIAFAGEIRDLTQEDNALAQQGAIVDFRDRFAKHQLALNDFAKGAAEQTEELDAALAELEVLRNQGRRALAKALFLDSDQVGRQFAVNTVMRRHQNLARTRYEEARKNAVRMAFLAKRSIELRLGLRLSDVHDDLPLVSAPSTWESTVCASTGIDYSKFRSAADPSDGSSSELGTLGNFADAFIGSYVTKLENVVESYRLVNNFHEGTDTAVVSLRDDVQNVRAVCDTPVGNLLYHAGELAHRADPSTGSPGWETFGCGTAIVDGATVPLPNCVATYRLDAGGSAGPFPEIDPDRGAVRGYTVAFGPMGSGLTCEPSTCGQRADSALIQRVSAGSGFYRLSWYARETPGAENPLHPETVVRIRILGRSPIEPENGACPAGRTLCGGKCADLAADPSNCGECGSACSGTQVCLASECTDNPTDSLTPTAIPGEGSTWTRFYFTFALPTDTEIAVAVQRNSDFLVVPQQVDVAAIMLENVSKTSAQNGQVVEKAPGAFANTSDTLTRPLAVCQDTDGKVFRSSGWRRECVRLCPDGFSSDCTTGSAQTYCFRETVFSVNQRDIEAGKIFTAAGFARGNFNYRIESTGINFVGTNIRNCAGVELASACHGAGFATYSLQHDGPYLVRNHMGRDFRADLFTGRIEHARGLAIERYLTNPLSSADRELIGGYLRGEFRGRPLDGHFVLRVWEEPGVDFDAIEDVQVVLNYRYWTRFD